MFLTHGKLILKQSVVEKDWYVLLKGTTILKRIQKFNVVLIRLSLVI